MNKKLTSILLTTSMLFMSTFTFTEKAHARVLIPTSSQKEVSYNSNHMIDDFLKDGEFFLDLKNMPESVKSKVNNKHFKNSSEVEKFLNNDSNSSTPENSKLSVEKIIKDDLGKKHYKVQYFVNGIPVYGCDLILHTDNSGKIYAINGELDKTFENINWNKRIKLQSKSALEIAENHIKPKKIFEENSKLYLYNFDGNPYVVYLVNLNCESGDWKLFINAENGQIVDEFNNRPILLQNDETNKKSENKNITNITNSGEVTTGTGRTTLDGEVAIPTYCEDSKYYLCNRTKNMNGSIMVYNLNNSLEENDITRKTKDQVKQYGPLMSDDDNKFIDAAQIAGVDAYINFSKVYDYYRDILNRNSIDNNGMDIEGFVHVGNNYNNAFWFDSHKAMYFGDGDGKDFSSFTAALDVIAHELSHGVTSMQSNLEYRKQSGALNEAFSDIIGAAVDDDDWQIGEDCYTPDKPGDALRDMQDPHKGNQPAHMSEYKNYPALPFFDWGGVHINSGIINHAAYYIGESLGKPAMAKLFYRANCLYWRSTTNFSEARKGVELAAKDLYGDNSKELKAVQQAFDNVGVK